MRRKDREVKDKPDIEAILAEARVCRLAFVDEGRPYIVPLNFGWDWAEGAAFPILYFHCAREGRKLELMRARPLVGFELDVEGALETGPKACDWGMAYASVIGDGLLSELSGEEERRRGLDAVMRQYGFSGMPDYDPRVLGATRVLSLSVETLSAKRKT